MNKPFFCVVDGPDGVGKGVQSAILHDRLAHVRRVEHHREPTGGDIGQLIRRALRYEIEMPAAALRLLFAADRLQHSERIAALLASGVSVVCDRYALSNSVYAYAERQSSHVISAVDALARCCVQPDLTIVLQAPVDVCVERMRSRGAPPERYENREMQEQVHLYYRCSGLYNHIGPVSYVDASGTPDEVAERLWRVVSDHLSAVAN